jgi:2-phosphosulfolactate phosphatase
MNKIDVCLSPELIHLYDVPSRVVVIVDILRATSCMTSGLAHGVEAILPVADLETCRTYKSQGYLIAGERNGEKVEGFDMGNSPFEYMAPTTKGKKVAVTTTNGTQALEKSRGAKEILIGSFLNLSVVAERLVKMKEDVLIVCAGWKGKVNLEDSLFAGALVEKLKGAFASDCDAPLMAQTLYTTVEGNLEGYLRASSHVQRLKRLHIHEDIKYCLTPDLCPVVPVLRGHELVIE